MFESAELGRKISRTEFDKLEPELHTNLLTIQRELRGTKIPVIIIVSGVEGAGKGEVVNQLNEWLDTRGIETTAYWVESDEERERPAFWRFWRRLPARGTIGIMFGSWYTRPIIDFVFKRIDQAEYEKQLQRPRCCLQKLSAIQHRNILMGCFKGQLFNRHLLPALDRHATIDILPAIIPLLRQFVLISTVFLLHLTRGTAQIGIVPDSAVHLPALFGDDNIGFLLPVIGHTFVIRVFRVLDRIGIRIRGIGLTHTGTLVQSELIVHLLNSKLRVHPLVSRAQAAYQE